MRRYEGVRVTFRPSGPPRPPAGRPTLTLPRWPRLVLPVVGVVIAVLVVIAIVAGVWTDFLWFRSVHYSSVFGTTYGTRWALFFVAGLFMVAVVGFNAALAHRLRPMYRPVATQGQGLEAYRISIDPHRRLLLGVILGVVGLICGLTASGSWRTWLLFANQVPFGVKDPQFHRDISFFVFTYPFIRMVLTYLFAAVLLSLIAAGIVHYLYGGGRVEGRRPRATVAAQAQLFVLFGTFVLLKAVAYWVDRYGIDFSQRGAVTTGASYTDVNAVLPAKTVLAVIALLCALLFFAGAARRDAARRRIRPAGPVGDPDRRGLPGHHPAVRGEAQRAGQGDALHPAGDHHHPAGLRAGRRQYHAVPGDLSGVVQPAGQPGQQPERNAAARPRRGVVHVPATPAGQELLQVPGRALDGPVHLCQWWVAAAGHGGGGAGHGRAAARAGQLDQHAPRVHARLRGRRRQGQLDAGQRQPFVRGE